MSAKEIIAELPNLTEEERQSVLHSLLELTGKESEFKEEAAAYRAGYFTTD